MEFIQPTGLREALEAKAAHPEARSIAGGTDIMVEINFDRARPGAILDLTGVEELQSWEESGGRLRVGAGVTYSRIITDLGERLPGLSMASRTVGSPQIRNRATVGGNLGTASPAGDALPPLYADGAEIEVAALRNGSTQSRMVPVAEFIAGPKSNALAEDELILAFHIPQARGPQQYAKIGPRNAMVIAVCAFGLSLDVHNEKVAGCTGSAGPTPARTTEAEAFIEGVLEEERLWQTRQPISDAAIARFGELAAESTRPITDVRGTEAYRRHAVGVLAKRTLSWAWQEHCEGARKGGSDAA